MTDVLMTGVNAFGFETGLFAPMALWARNWKDQFDQLASCGFNTVRLPYTNEMFLPGKMPSGIDFKLNPDLEGVTPIYLMDMVIKYLTDKGIMVLLDRHRPDQYGQSALWYTDHVSEQTWIDDWCMLAARYKDNKLVVGADLHNEPKNPATWGSGDISTDWKLAAERCGRKILEITPCWKIVVEGIESYNNEGTWWGGNLMGVRQYPIDLPSDNLVYSPHEYGPVVWGQQWFQDPTFPNNMPKRWDDYWGFIAKEGLGRVMVGEFGAKSVTGDTPEAVWIRKFVEYLKANKIGYTFWTWTWNSGDTGGVLKPDAVSLETEKIELLKTHMAPLASAQNTAPGDMPPENPPGGDYGKRPPGIQ